MTAQQFFFIFLGFMMIGGALMFVSSKNLVHAVLYFLVSMLSMAGFFMLLNAAFLAATHILVYAGAITVLILFVVMLTITKVPEVSIFGSTQRAVPALASAAFFAIMAWAISKADFAPLQSEAAQVGTAQLTRVLGQRIFLDYLFPFEVAAFLLLIALVAAVYLAVGERD